MTATVAAKTMRALAKTQPGPGVELIERETPVPGPGEVLLRVDAASICGTDLHLFQWDEWAAENLVPPRILGHELAGTVVAIGSGVTRVREGDLVGVESHLFCWECAQMRPVPARRDAPLPQSASHRRPRRRRVRRARGHP
jgi:threonine 3-dehydrogenase